MIKVSPDSSKNFLILEAQGKLTDRDYKEVLIPRLESIIKEHGKARLLIDMGDHFEGWEPKAAWDDARFGLAHRKDFEKMAVISDRKWVEWALRISALLVEGEIRSFSPSERDDAHAWIKA